MLAYNEQPYIYRHLSWLHKAKSTMKNSLVLQKAVLISSCTIWKPLEATIYYYQMVSR